MAAYLERVNLLFELRRYSDAERALRDALADDPDDALAHAMLGVALRQLGGVKAALEESENAIRLDPTSSYVFYARSLVLIRANRSPEALQAVREAIRLDSDCDPDYFMILGALLFDKQEWSGCLAALDRALSLDPHHVACLNLRGRALLRVGREEEAEQAFAAALAAAPNHAESHHARGVLLLHRAEGAAALDYLLEARRLDPLGNNDSGAIALAVGRQMVPFCWTNRWIPRCYLWRPQPTGAFFLAILIVYAILNYFFPIPPDKSPVWHVDRHNLHGFVFGFIAVNLLLVPFTFDVLATLAALVGKPRLVGTKPLKFRRPALILLLLLFCHEYLSLAGLFPRLVMLILLASACAGFIIRSFRGPRKKWSKSVVYAVIAVAVVALGSLLLATMILFPHHPIAWTTVAVALRFAFVKIRNGVQRREA